MKNVDKIAKEIIAIGRVTKPTPGRQYGTTDQGPPEDYTEYQLSRIADILYAAQEAKLDPKKFWKILPDNMKMEWNYAKWKYESLK